MIAALSKTEVYRLQLKKHNPDGKIQRAIEEFKFGWGGGGGRNVGPIFGS